MADADLDCCKLRHQTMADLYFLVVVFLFYRLAAMRATRLLAWGTGPPSERVPRHRRETNSSMNHVAGHLAWHALVLAVATLAVAAEIVGVILDIRACFDLDDARNRHTKAASAWFW